MTAPTETPAPLPIGFRIVLDDATTWPDERTLFGGSPARVLRLSPAGLRAWAELRDGPVTTAAGAALARRLTDAGLAQPQPPRPSIPRAPSIRRADVTVVVPAYDRPAALEGCLRAVGGEYPVLVVDDGSVDARAVAEVAAGHGARVVRRAENGGPARARNTALTQVGSEFVAFLDSDCVPEPGWIEGLLGHVADPLVAAAAPRIVARPSATSAGRYTSIRGTLDLGPRAARVVPGTRVAYVPTAALLVRRRALLDVSRGGDVFDPDLRFGEDVDLVWRLHEAGWRVRYDPSVRVGHHDPDRWAGLAARRFRYGTSAAPLARRHPGAVAPLVLHPWPTVTVGALLARRPFLAGLVYAGSVLAMTGTLRRADVPAHGVTGALATGVRQTWLGLGRYATQFAAPALVGLLVAPGGARRSRRWGRRAAAASLLLGPPLAGWFPHRARLDPVRFVLGQLGEDVAYGAGVWTGCRRAGSTAALRPRLARPLGRPGRLLTDRASGSPTE